MEERREHFLPEVPIRGIMRCVCGGNRRRQQWQFRYFRYFRKKNSSQAITSSTAVHLPALSGIINLWPGGPWRCGSPAARSSRPLGALYPPRIHLALNVLCNQLELAAKPDCERKTFQVGVILMHLRPKLSAARPRWSGRSWRRVSVAGWAHTQCRTWPHRRVNHGDHTLK